jgi:4-carboxymuconolactone decarboxylase
MTASDPPPRMAPVDPANPTAESKALLERWVGAMSAKADNNPVLLTLAHHPGLAEVFSPLNIHLLKTTTLPLKLRQIAIMRTSWICKSAYMWSSHLATSLRNGLSDDMFGPIQHGADDPYFSAFERSVVRATEDLVQNHKINDTNWQALAAEWNEQQMLDFLFTVGIYVTMAGVMRSTGVQRDAELRALAERYGAPE